MVWYSIGSIGLYIDLSVHELSIVLMFVCRDCTTCCNLHRKFIVHSPLQASDLPSPPGFFGQATKGRADRGESLAVQPYFESGVIEFLHVVTTYTYVDIQSSAT